MNRTRENRSAAAAWKRVAYAFSLLLDELPQSTGLMWTFVRGFLHGGRKILALGRSWKADHPSAICFLYSVYMQKVVLGPSARIFLKIGTS